MKTRNRSKVKKGGRVTAGKPKDRIRIVGDDILDQRALDVFEHDGHTEERMLGTTPAELRILSEKMHAVIRRDDAVGLAAPQIGTPLRVLAFDVGGAQAPDAAGTGQQRRGTLLDPYIVELGTDMQWYNETCLSIPGLVLEIERPRECLVAGYDLEGNPVEIEASGLLARVLQHEIDHLFGQLMVDLTLLNERQRAVADSYIVNTQLEKRPQGGPYLFVNRDGDIKADW